MYICVCQIHTKADPPQLGEIGAGIQFGPNAFAALDALGIARRETGCGCRPGRRRVRCAERDARTAVCLAAARRSTADRRRVGPSTARPARLRTAANGEDGSVARPGALLALLVVVVLGLFVHKPLASVPENTLKFGVGVGVVLSAFGTFWVGEGIGLEWPGSDWALVALVAAFLAFGLALVPLYRRRLRSTAQPRAKVPGAAAKAEPGRSP
jgi:hypothetical protein